MAALTIARASPSARRGDNPWRGWRRLPWGRWGRGRPGHWGGGYARYLIPFGIHTLDIRHVIPGLRSRCGDATCPQAARTSQDETTSSSNSCPSRRIPSPSANETPTPPPYARPYTPTRDGARVRCPRRFYAELSPRILPALSIIRLED